MLTARLGSNFHTPTDTKEKAFFDVQLEDPETKVAPGPQTQAQDAIASTIHPKAYQPKTNLASPNDHLLEQNTDSIQAGTPMYTEANGDHPQQPTSATSTPAAPSSSTSSKLCSLLQNAWWGLQSLSEWVTEFVGITAPRYEMYMDDSIEFLQSTQEDVEDEGNYVKITMDTW
jgi:hypothetical protein